jgi:uncharacterized protein
MNKKNTEVPLTNKRDPSLEPNELVGPHRPFFQRWSVVVILAFVFAMPALVYWAGLAIGTNSNRLADWLPSNLEETVELAKFDAWFGDGQFVVVSWDGCRIDTASDSEDEIQDDPRLERLARMLVSTFGQSPSALEPDDETNGTDAVEEMVLVGPQLAPPSETVAIAVPKEASVLSELEQRTFFRKVITSRSLLQTLTDAPLSIESKEAVRRLTGSIIGTEGQACLIIFLNELSTDQLRQAIGVRTPRWIDRNKPQGALFRAIEACDIPLDSAYFGGPPIDNLSINEEGQRTLVRLALAAGSLGLALAWWSLRSVVLTLIVFSCGIVSTCGATAAIWLCGSYADAIVLAMPSLIYVLTISGAIHLVNYYREAVLVHGIAGAAGRSLRAGYKPAALCSFTTAIGLLSLFASDLTPIRRFGIFSAMGMLLMLVVLFLLLPAALEFFGRKHAFGFAVRSDKSNKQLAACDDEGGLIERWALRWAHWVIGHYRVILLISIFSMTLLSGGIGKIRTSVDLLKLFDSKTRILADYHWLEENLGSLVPLEVLIRFDADSIGKLGDSASAGKMKIIHRAQVVDKVRSEIDKQFGKRGQGLISPTVSAATFLPQLGTGQRGTSAVIRNRVLDTKLENSREALRESGYVTIDPATGDEIWRISLRVAAFKEVDYGLFAEEVKTLVDPILEQASVKLAATSSDASVDSIAENKDATRITAIHTGAIPIVYKAQRALLGSLIESTVWSFLTITPLLMWVTRGVAAGCVAMLPNLLPVLAVFGSMGWLGIPVDIGCMMTASIALGVAVDDTIHFLCWYRHGQETCSTRNAAIETAFRTCCRPTLQASLVNGLGLSVFLLSTFVPTKQFGLLMLVILTCGAVAELVMLPAILASPMGRVFDLVRGHQRIRHAFKLFGYQFSVMRR